MKSHGKGHLVEDEILKTMSEHVYIKVFSFPVFACKRFNDGPRQIYAFIRNNDGILGP